MPKQSDVNDISVGNNIRRRRLFLSMSQGKLAGGLGITFQQVQKYEKGANRVSASKLVAIASLLECSVTSLFDGTGNEAAAALPTLSTAALMVAANFDRLRARHQGPISKLVASMVPAEPVDNTVAA